VHDEHQWCAWSYVFRAEPGDIHSQAEPGNEAKTQASLRDAPDCVGPCSPERRNCFISRQLSRIVALLEVGSPDVTRPGRAATRGWIETALAANGNCNKGVHRCEPLVPSEPRRSGVWATRRKRNLRIRLNFQELLQAGLGGVLDQPGTQRAVRLRPTLNPSVSSRPASRAMFTVFLKSGFETCRRGSTKSSFA